MFCHSSFLEMQLHIFVILAFQCEHFNILGHSLFSDLLCNFRYTISLLFSKDKVPQWGGGRGGGIKAITVVI